ncbi:glycosyltransferase family 2 protein [Cohnella luojiensis]|uniref:Glycosyltransferase n=1 Tax=Cohnella luojiensis TaxID=652876 RepID=A0A4Y8LNQ4_9BACL|nr:glycosyltransferase [Cohnella luojiensis]TFE22638.1 glycosyltransferase [Cohnella luojiensis]
MRISVLIPTYCRVNDLTRCLEAIFSQTVKPHEIILVVREDDTETLQYIGCLTSLDVIKVVKIDIPGVVQAMNKGLCEVSGEVVAITDDDSEPFPQWLERIENVFEMNKMAGGVGGRDWIHQGGIILDGKVASVGKIQWFGRRIGNHHLRVGSAREVDFLKGVNCAYRTDPLKKIGFDHRLLGKGAQVHWELSVGLTFKRMGWKLIYDPIIGVGHYPSQRFDEDKRNEFNPAAVRNEIHNETLIVWEHFSVVRKILFLIWASLVGSTSSPGLLQLFRGLVKGEKKIIARYYATITGRYLGIIAWKRSERIGDVKQ